MVASSSSSFMGVVGAVVLLLVVCCGAESIAPSDRQTRELLLLDSLGGKGIMGSADQDTIIDMLGRSRFDLLFINIQSCLFESKQGGS